MATKSLTDVDSLTLNEVEWEIYCKLRDAPANDHLQMTYLDGELTIISAQLVHDLDSRRILFVISAVARAWRIPLLAIGTTTLRKKGRVKVKGAGKEPDEGVYLGADVSRIRGKTTLDLNVDPPPTLALEVDNLAKGDAKLRPYARIGVPEVWRFDAQNRTLWFGRLDGKGYQEIGQSLGLPRLTPTRVIEALDAALGVCQDELEWFDWLDVWARALPEPSA